MVSLLLVACGPEKKRVVQDNGIKQDTLEVKPGLNKYLKDCGVQGSIAIYNAAENHWVVSDSADVKAEALPASTFKIINLLIALQTGVIADENAVVKWVGKTDTALYGYRPEIYHDMSVKEAFQVSAGWVFIELAKKIGRTNYQKFLQACHYGNLNLSETGDDFWNFGKMGISPVNQIQFLSRVYRNDVPFSKRNIDILKQVMITEETPAETWHTKTGWTRQAGMNTGWWVGYVENKKGVYVFATKLIQDRKFNRDDFGSCRKDITKAAFRELKLIK